jgi:hypothetical protein
MNEDGTFILQVGGVDIGTGVETGFAQIAAEVLGCQPEDILVESGDTDVSPFDYGTYASSTTFHSGQSVKKAAEDARGELLEWAARIMETDVENLETGDREVCDAETGECLSFEEIGQETIYGHWERDQIMGQGTWSTNQSPPPFGAQFVDVTVDDQTGEFEINKMAMAADAGVALNPALVKGQIDGGQVHSLEYATGGEVEFDEDGTPTTKLMRQYDTPRAPDVPEMESIIVETHEPTGPFGAKSIAEIVMNGVPPALSNAIKDAVGIRVTELPITAEKVAEKLE